jgi:hypothetical protein
MGVRVLAQTYMPRQIIPALLLLTSCLAFAPSARADIFQYDVQFTQNAWTAHVIFELPSFQETVENQTTFDLATWTRVTDPPTGFSISGNSTTCDAQGWVSFFGPCVLFENDEAAFVLGSSYYPVPAFNGPGTYTLSTISDEPGLAPDWRFISTTVIITDISTVPEPSALVLLSSCLLGVGLVVRKRRFHQRPAA